MPTATGRAYSTANLLANLAALKAINFGSADPSGVWFVVPNPITNNIEIWVWQADSILATDEISVVRPDSVVPGSPGRCIQRLKFDASQLGGVLSAINALNTAGIIERTAEGGAAIIGLSTYARGFLSAASDSAARATLGLSQINNTSDLNKPVSYQQQYALDFKADWTALDGKANSSDLALKANLISPTFTGTPAVPTATAGTNTTQAASTAFVTAGLALKANLASPTFTGTPAVPTATAGTNTTQAASTAFVTTNFVALTDTQTVGGAKTFTDVVRITNTTQATSTTTGAQIISGGQSVVGNQHIGGFTFLGDNIGIKAKRIITTTASTQGGLASVAHGLTTAKIVSIIGIVRYLSNAVIGVNHLFSAGYQFDLSCDSTVLYFINVSGNSINILSKPAEAIIFYVE